MILILPSSWHFAQEIFDVVRKTEDVTGNSGPQENEIILINLLRFGANRISSIVNNDLSDLSQHIELIDNVGDFFMVGPRRVKVFKITHMPISRDGLEGS